LVPDTRRAIAATIKSATLEAPEAADTPDTVRGTLRAVHLDDDWIEVTVESEHVRITNVGEAVDDLIGPMVNRPVVVETFRTAAGAHRFRDIEADD